MVHLRPVWQPFIGTLQSKEVYLLVNQLPTPDPDKQYQLWAIVDGNPVDAGVFDMIRAFPCKTQNHTKGRSICNYT